MTAPTHAGSSTTKIGMRTTFLLFFYFEFLSSVQQRHINVNATMAHSFDVGIKNNN